MRARSSWFAIISSNQRRMMIARCLPVWLRHAGHAALAASMAARTSSAPSEGTRPISAPVAGSVTSIVLPSLASIHLPST